MKPLYTLGILTSFFAVACGSAVPQELARARTAYEQAAQGPAAENNPAGLHTAKQTLEVAEFSFTEEGDSQETRDLAYAAERKAQVAEAKARDIQSEKAKERTIAQMHSAQTAKVQTTSAELGQARAKLGVQGQQLLSEQSRREDAERRAAAANAALLEFATVKQEPRGMVITLSGAVLFASGKADLFPTANTKLDNVVTALTSQSPESKMVVEGHTDSQGAAAFNQDLSQKRAESVRAYLVSHGIASDRVRAQGFGLTRPIGDNASPEGRANNRRVEIIVTK